MEINSLVLLLLCYSVIFCQLLLAFMGSHVSHTHKEMEDLRVKTSSIYSIFILYTVYIYITVTPPLFSVVLSSLHLPPSVYCYVFYVT